MTFTDAQKAELAKPLAADHIKKPTGRFGPKGDYLEGWHVINEMNRVFGFDGWSYQIDLTRDALELGKDSNGNDQWQAAYTCICTLTVGDVTRQDVGFGSGFAKGVGDAIEGATKEAATDALKRCARTFGNIFGLALYDKSRANVGTVEMAPRITEAQQTELINLLSNLNVPAGDFLATGGAGAWRDIRDVPASQFELGKKWIHKRARDNAEKAKERA